MRYFYFITYALHHDDGHTSFGHTKYVSDSKFTSLASVYKASAEIQKKYNNIDSSIIDVTIISYVLYCTKTR